jgi:hypothetical protein
MKSQMIQMNKMYNNDVEIYRKIVGFLNYSVSNWGNMLSDVTGKVLRLTTDKAGYKMITLSKSQTETIKLCIFIASWQKLSYQIQQIKD